MSTPAKAIQGNILPTYTGFPLFLTFTSIVQIAVFIWFYTGSRCDGWSCDITRINQAQLESDIILIRFDELVTRHEYWRLWTYQFTHAGVTHLIVNVIFQLLFGALMETVQGPVRIATLYTFGVVVGGAFSMLVSPNSMLVGASGGVYTIIIAFLANTILNFQEMQMLTRGCRLILALAFILADVGQTLYTELNDIGNNVSWITHLGGALVGLLLGFVVLKNFQITRAEIKIQIASFVLFCLLVLSTVIAMIVTGFQVTS